MKKLSLNLLALILISSASSSFGMENAEGNNTPNTSSSVSAVLKHLGKAAIVVLAVMSGKEIYNDQVANQVSGPSDIPIEETFPVVLERYKVDPRMFDYLGNGYQYGKSAVPSKVRYEMFDYLGNGYEYGQCPVGAYDYYKSEKPWEDIVICGGEGEDNWCKSIGREEYFVEEEKESDLLNARANNKKKTPPKQKTRKRHTQ